MITWYLRRGALSTTRAEQFRKCWSSDKSFWLYYLEVSYKRNKTINCQRPTCLCCPVRDDGTAAGAVTATHVSNVTEHTTGTATDIVDTHTTSHAALTSTAPTDNDNKHDMFIGTYNVHPNGQVTLFFSVCVCLCVLCAVCCVLCAVCCVLCAVCCVLCAVCCVLCAVCCVLCAVCCVLCAVCCVLCAVCCVLSAVCCVLCAVCCLLCACAVCRVSCVVFHVPCSRFRVPRSVFVLQ